MKEGRYFDLILLDLSMPKVDGFEVLATVKDSPELSRIPIIVMSANDDNEIIARCLNLGAIDYLIKPIRMQECRNLSLKLKQREIKRSKPQNSMQLEGLAKYKLIEDLGQGMAG